MNIVDCLYCKIDLNHPEEGEEFRKNFYSGFNKLKNQTLIRKIWNWDDEQQTISLRIPNEDVSIYAFKNEQDQNIMYVGGIYDRRYCQFDKWGFQAPADAGKYLEIIALFSTIHFNGNLFNFEKVFVKDFCDYQAREYGCESLIATCSPMLLRLYLKWNFKVVDTRNLDGGIRHLIKLDL